MAKKKFNPAEWEESPAATSGQEQPPQAQPPRRSVSINRDMNATLEEQIAEVTRRIEEAAVDITAGYETGSPSASPWRTPWEKAGVTISTASAASIRSTTSRKPTSSTLPASRPAAAPSPSSHSSAAPRTAASPSVSPQRNSSRNFHQVMELMELME